MPIGTLHYSGVRTRYWPLEHARALFFHPTLHELTISCATADKVEIDVPIRDFQGTTPLRSLTLTECHISMATMEVLLSIPKALQTLEITSQRSQRANGGQAFSRIDIIHNLVVHQPKLEKLTYAHFMEKQPGTQAEDHKLNLSLLQNLKHLALPYNCSSLSRRLLPMITRIAPKHGSTSLETVMLGMKWDKNAPQSMILYHRTLGLYLPGYPNLRTLVITFDGLAALLTGEQASKTQATLDFKDLKNSLHKDFGKSKVRLILQMSATTGRYVPPYLFGEIVPRIFTIYDSGAEDPMAGWTEIGYEGNETR